MMKLAENSPEKIPSGYKNLFALDSHLEKVRGKEIEAIILEVCSVDRKIQFEIKINFVKAREHAQDQQSFATDAKVSVLVRKLGIILDGAGVLCEIGSALYGGPNIPAGLAFKAVGGAFSNISGYRERINQSEITKIDHGYQRVGSLLSDRSQGMQSADRQHEQDSTTIDRIMQTTQRTFELVASGNS